jgi:hypothetical protein
MASRRYESGHSQPKQQLFTNAIWRSSLCGYAAQSYQEAAWLTTQFGSNSSNDKDLQFAPWFLMNPNLTKYDAIGAQVWLDMAGKNYTSNRPERFPDHHEHVVGE